jgi:hypothetical protein
VSLLVWLAFGAVAVAPAVEVLNWQIVLYAVLSLTVIRMAQAHPPERQPWLKPRQIHPRARDP